MAEPSFAYDYPFIDGIAPDPFVTITQWADDNRVLTTKGSPVAGKYRSSWTPYVREPMDELSPQSRTQTVVVMKPVQSGGTEIANNFLMFVIDITPGPFLFLMPTVELARGHSKKKVQPSIDATPSMKGKVKEVKSRDSGNTILQKEFPGGDVTFGGSASAAALRSQSIRFLVIDDYDGWVSEAGDEGEPGDLAKDRTTAYQNRKIFINSTPTVKGLSNIEREYKGSSQGKFNVPCPHCGELQFLKFGGRDEAFGIKFERDDDGQVTDAWYICEHCQERIDEHHKTAMLAGGVYIHKYPNRAVRGFHYNAIVAPLGLGLTWVEICQRFLKAKDSPRRLKVWTNNVLAEPFEEKGSQPSWAGLKNRAEDYSLLTVPDRALMLTAGVDTQDDRLSVSVFAFGMGFESWLVYHNEIYGDPIDAAPWGALDALIMRDYAKPNGEAMPIISVAVDTQGHRTQAVYNYARTRWPKVMAIQGASKQNRPVVSMKPTKQDVNWQGVTVEGGVLLWTIGTDTAKSEIYARLQLEKPGPGFVHFPAGLPDEYYRQLTAEKQVTRYTKDGYPKAEWVKVRDRNEALDNFVYAYAAAIRAGLLVLMAAKPTAPAPPEAQGSVEAPRKGGWIARR